MLRMLAAARGVCLAVGAGIFLSGCLGTRLAETIPADSRHASAELAVAAKAGAVPAGKARVYVYLGHWHYPDAQVPVLAANVTPSELYLNQIDVAAINPGECLVLDLPPGMYTFSWLERSNSAYETKRLAAMIAGGETRFLTIETDQRRNTEPPVTGYFLEQQQALPDIAPLTIVLPDASMMDRVLMGAAPL